MQASTSTKYRPVSSTCLSRGRRSMSLQPPNGPEHLLGADKIEAPVNATQRTGASFMPHGGRGDWRGTPHDIDLPSRLATLSFGHVAGLIQHHGRGVFGQRVAPQTNGTARPCSIKIAPTSRPWEFQGATVPPVIARRCSLCSGRQEQATYSKLMIARPHNVP